MLKVAGGGGGATGAVNYKGTWNASANSPTLTSSVGNQGDYYVVNIAGTTNLNGITDWQVGDWAIFNGSVWQKVDNTDAVTSVNGQTGAVVLAVANIAGAVPNTVNVLAGGLLTGGGALTGNVTISLDSVPSGNVSGLGTMATQNANAVAITGGSVTANVTSNNVNLTGTTSATATFATSELPLVPEGYITIQIGGVNKKIPYYGV
jgi:hypothetical protein